jgi:ABC-type branched-subunit amino acid transport system permease subunit
MQSPFQNPRPVGFVPLGIFFFFGSIMAAYAAITLLRPGTILDRAWALNRTAHMQFLPLGRMVAVPFAVLAAVLFLAGVGWFRRRYWGWLLGISLIATNLAGDIVNLALRDWLKGAVGVVIAGLLLVYMTRRGVRAYFLHG